MHAVLYNASILEQYASLECQNLSPQLAVYRDHELIIYSQKTTTLIEKIVQLFKDFIFLIMRKCGLLKIDPERVQQLKASVKEFYYSKISQRILEDLEMQEEILWRVMQKNKMQKDLIQEGGKYYQSLLVHIEKAKLHLNTIAIQKKVLIKECKMLKHQLKLLLDLAGPFEPLLLIQKQHSELLADPMTEEDEDMMHEYALIYEAMKAKIDQPEHL